jgi:mycoredoxin
MDGNLDDASPVTMYTTRWCGDCTITKSYLDRFNVPFTEVDIGNDPSAAAYVMEVNGGRRSVPTLVLNGKATSLSGFTREKFNAFLEEHDLLS